MDILYHYCSNEAFCSIIQNKKIRLSSLSLSSDSMEGKLVTKLLIEKAKEDKFKPSHLEMLQASVSILEELLDGLGFCLSEAGDLLSQWRGYAADGTGVSIGFANSYLKHLSEESMQSDFSGFTLQRIEYGHDKQLELIEPTYFKMKDAIKNGAFDSLGKMHLLDTRTAEQIAVDDAKVLKAREEFGQLNFSL